MWKMRVRRDSVEGRGSTAKETRETWFSKVDVRTVIGVELRHLRLLFCAHTPRTNAGLATLIRDGRRGTGGTERERGRAASGDSHTMILLQMPTFAPALERDFQSVEIVDMRLSTISPLNRLPFSLPFWRLRRM